MGFPVVLKLNPGHDSAGAILLVVSICTSAFGSDPAYGRQNWTDWKVSRDDYVEFCNGNSVDIDLKDGSLLGSLGACAPDLDKPAKRVKAQSSRKDLVALRAAIRAASVNGYANPGCGAVDGTAIFSGPRSLRITLPSSQVTTVTRSPCPTAEGRKVFEAFERAIAPLHRLGFRRWN
jgi:hypothetical protein